MAASEDALGKLHTKLANVLTELLDGTAVPEFDEEGNEVGITKIPPSAAILTATAQFLKNNNITCTPADNNALAQLQEAAERRAAARAARNKPSSLDFDAATESASFRMSGRA